MTSVALVVQRVLVDVDSAAEVEGAADSDFAGTSLNFIFSDLQSLEEFGRIQKRCLVGVAQVKKRDPLRHRPCWDIRHHQSLVFRALCPTMDSK